LKSVKKINKSKICNKCHCEAVKKYYHEKVKLKIKEKRPKIRAETELKEVLNKKGKLVSVNVTREIKICNLCNVEKNYTEYYFITNKYKERVSHYMAPSCKQCYGLLYQHNNDFINSFINKEQVTY
jgi:vacuolar-type H+-ATPase catalytic subunit A/Vma1